MIAELIISDSEKDSDLYYATRFLAPDPFIFIQVNGKKVLIMGDLELDRAKAQARVNEVLPSSEMTRTLQEKGVSKPSLVDIACDYLKRGNVEEVRVPSSFPIEYADSLREKGLKLSYQKGPFFETRLIKTEEEVQWIGQTQRATEEAMKEAIAVIRSAKIKGEFLYHKNKRLTSEKIREILHLSLMGKGYLGEHTIVACGTDGIDPHNQGSGPLKAHQPIILDIFPRSMGTRYFADMTRTVVRGKASRQLKKMYKTVLEGQKTAFRMIRDGVDGKDVHEAIQDHFKSLGFETGLRDGRMQGFFHGTGHGVGLDIHELPRISQESSILKAGQVVTVEPGLYYLDAGGVRVEDMVWVTRDGNINLTRFSKELEIGSF